MQPKEYTWIQDTKVVFLSAITNTVDLRRFRINNYFVLNLRYMNLGGYARFLGWFSPAVDS